MQGYDVQVSSTAYPLMFLLISSSDHLTGLTGAIVAVTISKNGAAFAAPAGVVAEVGNGWYKVVGNATDTNTQGPLALHATAPGADPADALYPVVSYNPQLTSMGLLLAKTTNITGFNDIPATAVVSSGAINTSSGAVLNVTNVGTLTTYTGNTPQTGDSFARLGAPSGASIDADILSRLATSGYTAPPSAASIATAVLTDTGDNTTLGSPGKILSQLGGAFTSSSSSIYSTASLANAPTGGSAPTAAAIATAVWSDTTAGDFTSAGSPGKILVTQLGGAFSPAGSSVYSTASLANAPTGGSAPTAAAIAAAVWTDTGDNTVIGSPGKILAQLGGAFTTSSSSIYSTASLANAPTGSGGGGATPAAIATAVWTDLLASSDFASAASVGALIKANTVASVAGAVGSVTAPVTFNLLAPLLAARALDGVPDTALTLNDGFHCAIAAAAGKESVVGTTYTIHTPATGTTLRTFELDDPAAPTSRT